MVPNCKVDQGGGNAVDGVKHSGGDRLRRLNTLYSVKNLSRLGIKSLSRTMLCSPAVYQHIEFETAERDLSLLRIVLRNDRRCCEAGSRGSKNGGVLLCSG